MDLNQKDHPISTKKQRIVIVKVISAMTVFLLGIPFLLFLATNYYTNKGLTMDVYLMGQEYAEKLNTFYSENNACPTDQDIKVTFTEQDIADKITFLTNHKNKTCTITLTFKTLNISLDGKQIILSKSFDSQAVKKNWQCYSNVSSLYLPKSCVNQTSSDLIRNKSQQ